jgi:hypothetical protein
MKCGSFLSAILIAASDISTRQVIAQCEIEAVHLYPQYEAGVSVEPKYYFYLQTCMEARGFVWDSSRNGCHASARDPDCYIPPSN